MTLHCSVCGADNVSLLLGDDPPPVRCPKCTSPYLQGIVSAVGIGTSASSQDPDMQSRLQGAMTEALKDALAEGVSVYDAETIHQRVIQARDAVLSAKV